VKLFCSPLSVDFNLGFFPKLDYRTTYWIPYFSEEGATSGKNRQFCQNKYGTIDGIVTGIQCTGNYCDNISLECTKPLATGMLQQCGWSEKCTFNWQTGQWECEDWWLSEHDGGWFYSRGPRSKHSGFITGVECRGSNCSAQRFRLCSLKPDPNVGEFIRPTVGNNRLDFCQQWGRGCGKPAADAFCVSQGYESARDWDIDSDIGVQTPTKIFSTGQICDQSFCDGFKFILCLKRD
jgi:hypothetical protein